MIRLTTSMAIFDLYGLRRIVIHDRLDPVSGSSTEPARPHVEASLVSPWVFVLGWIADRRHHDRALHDLSARILDDTQQHLRVQELAHAYFIWRIGHGDAPFTIWPLTRTGAVCPENGETQLSGWPMISYSTSSMIMASRKLTFVP